MEKKFYLKKVQGAEWGRLLFFTIKGFSESTAAFVFAAYLEIG